MSEAAELMLEGVLLPTSWGASGEVEGVSLMTFDEHEYPIDAAAARDHDIHRLLRKPVQLTGVVHGDRVTGIRSVEPLAPEGGASARGPSRPPHA